MPAIVGPVQIVNISDGTILFGDTLFISPKQSSKSQVGSGGGNIAAFNLSYNLFSSTNGFDCNLIDQPISGNN